MIKNILFDMGGIIFRQNTPEAFKRFASFGINTDIYMGEYGQKEFFLDLESGIINKEQFCKLMAKACGKSSISLEEANYCWMGYITDVPVERLRYLAELKKNYHLGLASNTNLFVMDYMDNPQISEDNLPISEYFTQLYCSYLLGVCKPSTEYFNKILQLGNLKAEETLFLDDSLKNIKAAETIGIHGMHVHTNEDWIDRLKEYLA